MAITIQNTTVIDDGDVSAVSGTFSGSVSASSFIGRSTSTNRLASPTTFQITGDVDTDSFQFDGQQGGLTKTFNVAISENFKTTYANSLLAGDFGLIWNENNTVVDTNGFVKESSPIIRLFDSGIEEPVVSVDASFEKISTGHYVLHDVSPLATKGWQIEIPQDYNGKRLIFVDTIYGENTNTLAVYTSKRKWSQEQEDWVAGEPKDIPENRWVDLRFCEDRA